MDSDVKKNDTGAVVNVSSYLRQMGQIQPYKRAVVNPVGWDEKGRVAYTHFTFLQLDQESDRIAYGLERIGITRGVRTILMVKPYPTEGVGGKGYGLEFFALIFALFKVGAVPVIVDPGMEKERMAKCLQESRAEAFIGVPLAHLYRKFFAKYFNTIKIIVTVGRRWLWGGNSLDELRQTSWESYTIADTHRDETAAILFTTGSTGPPKGVVYTHGMFDAQIRHIRSHFNITPDEIDLPTFPLFALFDPALGMTAVIPEMDPTKPAEVNPSKIIDTITHQGVTNMFASPALLKKVGAYGKERDIKLPTLKRVISAGAPVYPVNIEAFAEMLSEGSEIHTPYGATEAMPVLSIGSREILSDTKKYSDMGFGMCIGRNVEDISVRIIKITDTPIEKWSDDLMVEPGDIGEIVVKGDVVSSRYFERLDQDELAKIKDEDGIWHRMGDLGWIDKKQRIWFCGRKSHRVVTEKGTFYTIPCEAIFNAHPAVSRSALVGIGASPTQKPVICIELAPAGKNANEDEIKRELLNIAARNDMIKDIQTILFYNEKGGFPVDIRHNAKIFREKIAAWAERVMV